MKFRFTLSNTISGTQLINEPDGWKGIKIKLERHPEYHSLVEIIDTNFFFYNQNRFVDGGREYLRNIELTQGLNALVSILIELTEDGTNYDEVFTGNLDLSTIKDVSRGTTFYYFGCSVIPDDLWATFENRKGTKIDLNSTLDLDGSAVAAPSATTLTLSSQAVRKKTYLSQYRFNDALYSAWSYVVNSTERYTILDLPRVDLDEIQTRFTYPPGLGTANNPTAVATVDLELFEVEEPGSYAFDIQIVLANQQSAVGSTYPTAGSLVIRLEINKAAADTLVETVLGTIAVNQRGRHTYTGTKSLLKGDKIKLWLEWTPAGPSGTTMFVIGNGLYEDSYISIIADTNYYVTSTPALLIHDAANALVKRMISSGAVYSDYFGGTTQGYSVNGCGYLNALMKGLHVRGYSFAEKPFAMSFDEWWMGANPIFNLGLGVESVAGVDKIRIEQKSHFYNDTPILYFDNVNDIERTYDKSLIFKSVNIGYQTWAAESASGIDDPQTKHTYATVFKMIGQDITIQSSFVAASLAIEQTRRNRKEIGTDWRLDDNVMIINLQSTTAPEIGAPFTSITNLLNSSTRYNIRLSVNRNLRRWLNYLGGCVWTISGIFRFTSGEGNYTMSVAANSDTCDPGPWTENDNVNVSASSPQDLLVTPEMLRVKVPLPWTDYQTLKANKTQAIAISQTDTDHWICHIQSSEYSIAEGSAIFKVWIK